MISFEEASAILTSHSSPLGYEDVALESAVGRVLAAPVIAGVDSPRAAASAMDGYALRGCDLATCSDFQVIGAAYPGASFTGTVGQGECVRIFTGARVPGGADQVVVQENIRQEGAIAHVETFPSQKRHIRERGIDFQFGQVLLVEGSKLTPRSIVAAAAADLATLRVWRRPRIGIVATGDELIEPGSARASPESIPESVSFGVAALAQAWGGQVVRRHRLRDELASMQSGVVSALHGVDTLVMTGGASVGDKDFARAACMATGAEVLFAKVAIQPGKPVWFARAGEQLILGLPGNPSAAMVTARLFLAPLIAGMVGLGCSAALQWRRLELTQPLGPAGERETFVRGCASGSTAAAVSNQDSGMQFALAEADLLIRRPPHAPEAVVGSLVDVLDF